MIRSTMFCLMAFVIGLTASCASELTFYSGTPYHSEYWLEEAAFVALPDKITDEQYKIKIGSLLWEVHFYKIPVGDVYSNEARAHLKGLFKRGVTVTTHSMIENLAQEKEPASEDSGTETSQEEETELQRILDEMDAKEEDSDASEKSVEELTEDVYREVGVEALQQKDAKYLVNFSDALFFSRERKLVAAFRAQLIDRRTGNVLFDRRYAGSSRRFEPVQSQKTNEEKLKSLTREAFNGPMRQLNYDIAVALDARGVQ